MTYPSKKKCTQCGEEKFLKEFRMYRSGNKTIYRAACKPCEKIQKQSYKPSKASPNLYGDTITCIKCKIEKPKEEFYWNTTSGYINKKCKICFDANNKVNERIQALRIKGIQAYGGECACCQETEVVFLTFDHINNDGSKHREEVRPGWQLYRWLEKNNYPDDFQILCYNCNWAKYRGGCPHQKVNM